MKFCHLSSARAIPPRRFGESLVVLAFVGHWLFAPRVIKASGPAEGGTAGPPPMQVQTQSSKTQGRVVDWIRAGLNTNRPVWGIRGGLLWGLAPASGRPDGPRGLIRLRYPVLTNGAYDLINFIAIEPVVQGRKGFSELERSRLDGVAGKRLWVVDPEVPGESTTNLSAGQLTRLDLGGPKDVTRVTGLGLSAGLITRHESGVEILTVRVGVERFENGARVALTLAQRSDAPDELEVTLHAEPDSAPLEYCILTATMGNKARARLLWLKEEVVSSLRLYPDYREPDFAPHRFFALDRLHRTAAGDVLAALTTDEANPAAVNPSPKLPHWRYGGFPVTQYWRKPKGTWRDDLHVAVNGRYTYWLSRQPIPGGIAFENFEMRERFHPGQRFVFGMTRKSPNELGFMSSRQEQPPKPAK